MRADAHPSRAWLSYLIGVVLGGILGAVVAVNVMIHSGVEQGYAAGIAEVFEHSATAGTITIAALVLGPVAGIFCIRWIRRSG